jgi:hypothetical protein
MWVGYSAEHGEDRCVNHLAVDDPKPGEQVHGDTP